MWQTTLSSESTLSSVNLLFALLFATTCILLFLFARLFSSHYQKWRLYQEMPSVPTSFFLGSVLGHVEYFFQGSKDLDITAFFHDLYSGFTQIFNQKKEGFFYLRMGPFRHFMVVFSAEAAKAIFNSQNNDKNKEFDFFKDWLGECLFVTNGMRWKQHRRLLTPAFHFEILNMFIPIMNSKVATLKSIINSKMDSKGIAYFDDLRPLVANCVLDVFFQTAMGVQLHAQEDYAALQNSEAKEVRKTPESEYIEAMQGFLNIFLHRMIRPWLFPSFLFRLSPSGRKNAKYIQTMQEFTNSVVRRRKEELMGRLTDESTLEESMKQIGESKRLAFLDLLLVQHLKGGENAFTLVDVKEEVDMFLAAGTDTTTTAIQFALFLLGLNPDKQQLIHDEVDQIFGNDKERDVTLDDIKEMTYMEMCIKESMRLYPSAVIVGRTVVKEFKCDKYVVPTGTTVLLLLDMIHRDPEWYQQPELFSPERFSPDSTEPRHSYAYLPFSSGARTCIGRRYAMLQMKLFLASIFRQYTVRTITQRDQISLNTFIVTQTLLPIQIEFTKRSQVLKQ